MWRHKQTACIQRVWKTYVKYHCFNKNIRFACILDTCDTDLDRRCDVLDDYMCRFLDETMNPATKLNKQRNHHTIYYTFLGTTSRTTCLLQRWWKLPFVHNMVWSCVKNHTNSMYTKDWKNMRKIHSFQQKHSLYVSFCYFWCCCKQTSQCFQWLHVQFPKRNNDLRSKPKKKLAF
jgi:hypothetical protein